MRSKRAYELLFGLQNELHYAKPVRRNTLRMLSIQQQTNHQQKTNDLLDYTREEKEALDLRTVIGEKAIDRKAKFVRKYKRQGALDFMDEEACDFMVQEILQNQVVSVKDSQTLYYKMFFQWKNFNQKKDSQGFNRVFGFKTKVVRDLQYPGMIMEIFKATDIQPVSP